MSAPAAKVQQERFDAAVSTVPMTSDQLVVLDALASALGNGSRPAAIRHLIDIHGGRALEALLPKDAAPAPFNVVKFAKPRLTRELISFVAGGVAAGLPLETSLDMAGVTQQQRRQWMSRGKKDSADGKESLYADYVMAVLQAQAMQKQENIAMIRSHRAKVWTASAWLLDRMYPDEFGERKRIDKSVQHSMTPMIDYERLSLVEQRELVRLLKKASPESGELGIGRSARPAAELLPGEVVEAVEDADFTELEAPALETEAPALGAPGVGSAGGVEERGAGDERDDDDLREDGHVDDRAGRKPEP